jgi:hypothetical protein
MGGAARKLPANILRLSAKDLPKKTGTASGEFDPPA